MPAALTLHIKRELGPNSEIGDAADVSKPEDEPAVLTDGKVFLVTLPIPESPDTPAGRLDASEVLGLTLSAECSLSPVTIVGIRADGAAATWNRAHEHTPLSLRIGDVISQVNGVRWPPRSSGPPQKLVDCLACELHKAQARGAGMTATLTLQITRTAPELTEERIRSTATRALADARARRDAARSEAIRNYLAAEANAYAAVVARATTSVAAEDDLRAALGWRPEISR